MQRTELELLNSIDPLCEEFESGWKDGLRPQMEPVLASVSDRNMYSVLFEHLLELELNYRLQAGECPTEIEYASRFPECPGTIGRVFARRSELHGLPTTIAQYQIERELGRGGMGIVYKAMHPVLQKHVAVKVLSRRYVDCLRARSRFDREMKIIGQVDDPHVVRILDGGEFAGGPFFVMELVEGNDLASLLQRHGPFPYAAACEIIRQAAMGLQAIHQRGLVHRDLKPANLMLTPEGVVRILDFGLTVANAHRKGLDGANEVLTTQNTVLGTLEYMAPEQIEQSSDVDIRADIYSLGATLYGLLCGKSPYASLREMSPVRKIIHMAAHPPAVLALQRPGLPDALVILVEQMMARNPSERIADPAQVVAATQPLASFNEMSQFILSATPYTAPLPAVTEDLERAETAIHREIGEKSTGTTLSSRDGDSQNEQPQSQRQVNYAPDRIGRSGRFRMLTAAFASLTLLAVLCGIVYVKTNKGVLRFEIFDPEVTVTISGSDVVLKGADAEKEIVVTPGARRFTVRRGDFEFETGELILRRGEVRTIEVSVTDQLIEVREDNGNLMAQKAMPGLSTINELHFSGKESIVVPSLKLNSDDDYTMECWVLEAQGSSGRRGGVALGFQTVSFLAISQERRWRWQFERRTSSNIASIPALSEPAHYACVRDGNIHRLFVNGVVAKEAECATPDSGDVPLTIGRDFIGRLDEIRISRVARYRESFAPARRFEADPDTLALYHCDHEQSGEFKDSSGNGHHGVMTLDADR